MKNTCIKVLGIVGGCALALLFSAAAVAGSEKLLYSFGATGTDGATPIASLIDVNGVFYGTTNLGGTYGYGTVFALDAKNGTETVIHSFGSGSDGQDPSAALINVSGTFYGTTTNGGATGSGVVFALDPNTDTETVVYSFCIQENCSDGANPYAGLIDVQGTLYGTTHGGAYNYGTVFALDLKTGAETALYSFCPNGYPCTDGQFPAGSLIAVKNKLYGTTVSGGANGYGAVFAINRKTGAETVIHSFGSGMDGQHPEAGLLYVKGKLYGTTYEGGTYRDGTVFALDRKTGAETVVYSFCSQKSCTDGFGPEAGLIDLKGMLYGTTNTGGSASFVGGTVFGINPGTGAETVLHSFGSGADGENPVASLINVKGTLYGTTSAGGSYSSGTAFAVTP